jgi:hypothetical protein
MPSKNISTRDREFTDLSFAWNSGRVIRPALKTAGSTAKSHVA